MLLSVAEDGPETGGVVNYCHISENGKATCGWITSSRLVCDFYQLNNMLSWKDGTRKCAYEGYETPSSNTTYTCFCKDAILDKQMEEL